MAPPSVLDPVCGMEVKDTEKAPSAAHDGHPYYFCCDGCRRGFEKEPEKYLNRPPSAPRTHVMHRAPAAVSGASASGAASGLYTCPMHPEVVQDGPGDCPICGMALEPLVATQAAPEESA